MSVSHTELKIGIVGAGGFAGFAISSFLKVPGVKVVAVFSRTEEKANKVASEFSAKPYTAYESFLQDDDMDLVYIATPPFLHYEQSKAALLAGKHVICEKPAALRALEAEELVEIARSRNLLYVVNLMQRYNPLVHAVHNIIKEKLLGEFLHGFHENYASDEMLDRDHWFWDEEKSGGIFIEHGVHFFDLFSGWLGKGEVIQSARWKRPGVDQTILDRVQATVNYSGGPVNFYHGFDQFSVLDRQEMRLQFEKGDITLYEWVPVKMKLHGMLSYQQIERLKIVFPGCTITGQKADEPGRELTGRFKKAAYDQLLTLEYGNIDDKANRYELLLISMIKDQWNWILDNSVERVIDGTNAVESVRMAEVATDNAQMF